MQACIHVGPHQVTSHHCANMQKHMMSCASTNACLWGYKHSLRHVHLIDFTVQTFLCFGNLLCFHPGNKEIHFFTMHVMKNHNHLKSHCQEDCLEIVSFALECQFVRKLSSSLKKCFHDAEFCVQMIAGNSTKQSSFIFLFHDQI